MIYQPSDHDFRAVAGIPDEGYEGYTVADVEGDVNLTFLNEDQARRLMVVLSAVFGTLLQKYEIFKKDSPNALTEAKAKWRQEHNIVLDRMLA